MCTDSRTRNTHDGIDIFNDGVAVSTLGACANPVGDDRSDFQRRGLHRGWCAVPNSEALVSGDGPTLGVCGISGGLVNANAAVDGRIVFLNTTNQAATDYIQVRAGRLESGSSGARLDVYDCNGVLIASDTVGTAPPAGDPEPLRYYFEINERATGVARIAAFSVSTPGVAGAASDTFIVSEVTINDPVACPAVGPDLELDAPILSDDPNFPIDTCDPLYSNDSLPGFGNNHDLCVLVNIPCPGSWLFDTCKSEPFDSIMALSLVGCGLNDLDPSGAPFIDADGCGTPDGHESIKITLTAADGPYPLPVYVSISGDQAGGACGLVRLNVCEQDAPVIEQPDKTLFEWPPDFPFGPVPPNTPQAPYLDPFNQPQTDQLGQDYSALAGPPQFEECDPNATVEYQDTLTGPFLPNCDKLWIVERVWTVTDVCGNAASVTQEINFQDTLPPVVTLKVDPLTLKQSADANCEGVMPDILAMEGIWFNAEDICTPTPLLDLQQFPAAGTPLPLGPTHGADHRDRPVQPHWHPDVRHPRQRHHAAVRSTTGRQPGQEDRVRRVDRPARSGCPEPKDNCDDQPHPDQP